MKNFRKVLALILVVATLFSFASMISAREVGDYTDYDKISYVEAVDVLTAIGILDGYSDGSFKPADNIAREEMAKMVAVLSNAGDDVSELYASACKFADTKDRWSASYVAYCNETGIVAGRNATTFDPRGKVTGIETAKMLLCLIGFDATAQGYVGSNWKTNVLRDAKNIGLLEGFAADYDISKAITREEAAQMMLNTLKAPMVVGTVSNNIVNISNNVWMDENGIKDVKITLTDAMNKYDCYVLYGNVLVSNKPVYSNYGDLELNPGADCYGNPSVVWTFKNSKGSVIFEKAYPAAVTYSYTKSATLADDLKEEIKNEYKYDLYIDGKRVTKNGAVTKANMNAVADTYTGNGVLTNVFVDDRNDFIVITVKNTYIGKVTSVSNYAGTFVLDGKAYDNTDFGFKKGDVVLYWLCGSNASDLHDAEIAPVVTGACTRTEVGNNVAVSKTTVDGKSYEYNKHYDEYCGLMGENEVKDSKNNGVTYDLYLDKYGYIMDWDPHTENAEVFYAYGVERTGKYVSTGYDYTGAQTFKYTNDIVDFEAKLTEDQEMDQAAWDAIKNNGNADNNNFEKGLLFSYTMNNGVAELVKPATQPGDAAYLEASGDVVRDGHYRFYGDSETQYMVRTWNYAKGEYEYNVYTRAELKASLAGYKYNSKDQVLATIQFFSEEQAGVDTLTYVFVDALYERMAQKAFVYSRYEYEISDSAFVNQIGNYKSYKAIINGEEAILAVTDNEELTKDIPYVYEAKLQVVGLLDGKTPIYSNVDDVTPTNEHGERLMYRNGNVYAEDDTAFRVADDCVVVVGDKANGKYYKLDKVEDLNKFFEDTTTSVPGDNNHYYNYTRYWLFNDGARIADDAEGGVVDEIFIVVNANVVNGENGVQH